MRQMKQKKITTWKYYNILYHA